MTQFLPANLLALFSPRDPLPYLPPPVPKHTKEECSLTGIGRYAHLFEDPEDTPEPQKIPTRAERQEAKRKEKAEIKKKEVEEEMKNWDPHNDPNATGDAFKTVFVSRINYDTREEKLRREFEEFGYIRKIHMVQDYKTNKPRGYAFIEYETEKGMRSAFKYGDGRKIDGRRVVVDIERGRTVKNWKPRKFGGGLGGTRIGAPDMNITHSGRVDPRQYQEKLARAQRMREREINMESKDEDRGNSRGRSLSRDTSVDRARSERNKSEKRDVSYDRRGKDDDRDRRRDRRDDRDRDRGDDRRRDRDRDDNRRRDRDDDRDRRRDKDRGGDDDRRRDRRDDDRKRDRSRRDRDGDREDRDRDREKDRDRDSKKEYSSEKYNDDNNSTLNDTINIKDEKNL